MNLPKALVARRSGDHAPLLRNAYALMANTVVTGVLGLGFWLLAARHYSAADVGRASAAYSAMNLIAGITALSLIGGMARFIPRSGASTGRLVRLGYVVSAACTLAGSAVFLAITGRPGSSYSELNSVRAGMIFAVCAAVWALFTLQDGVLTGMRSAKWVTLENALFGLAKIAMLLPLATIIPHTGLYVAWMVPAALAVPAVNWLIFRKLLPARQAQASGREGENTPPSAREVGRFLAGDVTGALLLLATVNLVPVLVASFVVPGLNAYFYMAWTIGAVIDLLAANMALSLTVEGAFDPVWLARHTKMALRRIFMLLIPTAAGVALLAPWLLGLFGPGYARFGAPILILLGVATLPRAVTEIYLGALRAQSRTAMVALVQGIRAVLIFSLTLVLIRLMGIIGAGVAVLVSQVVMAIAVTPPLLRIMTADRRQAAKADQDQASAQVQDPVPAQGRPRLRKDSHLWLGAR